MDGTGSELLVTSAYTEKQMLARVGQPAYSYRIVYRAFRSLLERWAPTTEIDDPETELDSAAARARAAGRQPIQLSFLPLQDITVNGGTLNIGVPAWEFPDLPNEDLNNDDAENWVRQSEKLDLIITHTQFSRDAFLKAGVRTPVHVVPVPVNTSYFDVPAWQADYKTVIDCPCYVFPQGEPLAPRVYDPQFPKGVNTNRTSRAKRIVKATFKRLLPNPAANWVRRIKQSLHAGVAMYRATAEHVAIPETPRLELSGVVYTSIFNPGDSRKNWRDMMTAFLYALGDRTDATLVFKLTTNKKEAGYWLQDMVGLYRNMRINHVCKVVFVTSYLSDEQMLQLARASTFYINASKSEGSCLPLQDYLAAGRPALAPANTGMADSLDAEGSFPVDSHPEPAAWPQDPEWRLTTTWHRLNWQSLHDQIRASYRMATENPAGWHAKSANARRKMKELVAPEAVWPLLRVALDEAVQRRQQTTRRAA